MKKSLFALAALGAFASAAQAQSTVTLYGTLDSSVALLTGVPLATSSTATSTTVSTTGSQTAFIDSSFATSSWGMRGSEDLGGGMKANFNVESDLLTNSGATHSAGLFRRAANVSLSHAQYGEVYLGRRGNAYIIATGQMLPVSGNTAHQWRNVSNSSLGDQISNSITYATPTIMQTNVVGQIGLNNTTNSGDDGQQYAAHLINKSVNNLQITAAYNRAVGVGDQLQASSAEQVTYNTLTAAATRRNQEGYAVGLKYKATPAIEIGTFYAHGRVNNGSSIAQATSAQSMGVAGLGLGYQATPALLLGANYAKTTFASSMTNLQAHYMLSKRTRVYSQMTFTTSSSQTIQQSTGGTLARGFSPIACNSSSSQVAYSADASFASNTCSSGLPTTAGAQNYPGSAAAYNLGVIHTF